ncbi:hypothetical protein HDU67_007911 [Dinochytrium kinnereticum]|nr:hypothetical protein HDU67_007911 [Dinochytrium kinnereticum]
MGMVVDHGIFNQLLEMDEDDQEREFSKGIVLNYFEQAESTFASMDASLTQRDLGSLSRLGHFLKGSSAALGLVKVRASCEKIQHLGNLKDETGSFSITDVEALRWVAECLNRVKVEHAEAEVYLRNFYGHQLAGDG